jgi:hypothetical protein
MNIPVFDKEKKEYLDFLYERIRKSYCGEFWDCCDCPYYDPKNPTRDCAKLTHEQNDSILIGLFHDKQRSKTKE